LDVACAFQITRVKVDCRRDERFVKARRVNPTKFLTELKRRNVYRAAVAYGVVAWFLTQLTTQVFPFFEIPNSAVRLVVMALRKNSAKSNRSKSHAIRAFRRREIRDWHVLVIDIRWLVLPELVMM